MEKKVWEWCPSCDTEVELKAIKHIIQVCPSCGKAIRACAMCQDCEGQCSTGLDQD